MTVRPARVGAGPLRFGRLGSRMGLRWFVRLEAGLCPYCWAGSSRGWACNGSSNSCRGWALAVRPARVGDGPAAAAAAPVAAVG